MFRFIFIFSVVFLFLLSFYSSEEEVYYNEDNIFSYDQNLNYYTLKSTEYIHELAQHPLTSVTFMYFETKNVPLVQIETDYGFYSLNEYELEVIQKVIKGVKHNKTQTKIFFSNIEFLKNEFNKFKLEEKNKHTVSGLLNFDSFSAIIS